MHVVLGSAVEAVSEAVAEEVNDERMFDVESVVDVTELLLERVVIEVVVLALVVSAVVVTVVVVEGTVVTIVELDVIVSIVLLVRVVKTSSVSVEV